MNPFNLHINRLEIVWTESNPLSLTLSPSPGGEGRVRGRPCLYNCATLNKIAASHELILFASGII
jgi:hypothetical protein